MATTLPPSIRPRLVEHEEGGGDRGGWLPEQTLRGALAGAEAAIGSWLVVVVVAVAGYVATATAPELGSARWPDAAAVGSAIWLLGHGGVVYVGAAAVTIIPLGITLLGVVGTAASLRRVRPTSLWPVAAAILVYTALAGAFAAFAGTPGTWRGVVGAPVVAAIGSLVAMRGRRPTGRGRYLQRVPEPVRAGAGAGLRAAALLLVLGLLAVLIAVVLGFPRIMDVHRSLVPDGASSVVMVIAQLVLLPTLVVWGAAFLAGPGFAVGEGTLFSPTGIEAGPLPVVPLLGALPEPDSPAGSLGAVVVLGVVVGGLAGWWLRRRHAMTPLSTAAAVAVTALSAGLVMAALAAASSGEVGPGRMALVGPDPVAVGLSVAWQVLLGAALSALLIHPTTVSGLATARAAVGRWWGEVSSPKG